jgi:phenylacetate-CoA ligase
VNEGLHVEPGESGELVITNLYFYAMPFIRYSVGDMGILSAEECSCGRGLPLMRAIEGRDVDFIVLADGRRVSPYLLTCAIEDIPGILRYQIVQETSREITVCFIKGEDYDADAAPAIESNCRNVLGEDVAVSSRIVDELSHDKSGKFSVVISKVSNRIPGNTTSLHKPFTYGPY